MESEKRYKCQIKQSDKKWRSDWMDCRVIKHFIWSAHGPNAEKADCVRTLSHCCLRQYSGDGAAVLSFSSDAHLLKCQRSSDAYQDKVPKIGQSLLWHVLSFHMSGGINGLYCSLPAGARLTSCLLSFWGAFEIWSSSMITVPANAFWEVLFRNGSNTSSFPLVFPPSWTQLTCHTVRALLHGETERETRGRGRSWGPKLCAGAWRSTC